MRRLLGAALVVLFFICAGYLVWTYYGTNVVAEHHQDSLVERYEKEAGDCIAPKGVDALLRIPEFGKTYVMPIVDSTDQDVLDSGVVGAYPGEPGSKGNYALIAHRVTHGEPFRDLPELGKGDKVIVEKDCTTYTYSLTTEPFVVPMSDTSVLLPKRGKEITLITCSELFHTENRTVLKGVLTDERHS